VKVDKKKLLKYDTKSEDVPKILSQKQRYINVFTFTDVYADMQELSDFIDKKLKLKFTDTEKAAKVMLAAALYFYGQEEMNLDLIKELFDEHTREDIITLRKLGISQFVNGNSPINIAMRAFEAVGIADEDKSSNQLVEEMQKILK